MSLFLIDLISNSLLSAAVFLILLRLKRSVINRCGIKLWHMLLFCNIALFIVPLHFVKVLLSPVTRPIRSALQDYTAAIYGYQKGVTYVGIPGNEAIYKLIFGVWLTGVVVCIIGRMVVYLLYVTRMKKESTNAPLYVSDIFINRVLADSLSNRRLSKVRLCVNNDILSPITYGFWRKTIILPEQNIDDISLNEIYYILKHEAAHITSRDIWKRFFALIVHSAHWFNPLFPLLLRNITEAIEMCCDRISVGNDADFDAKRQYSELLIAMIDSSRRRMAVGMFMAHNTFITKRVALVMKPAVKLDKLATGLLAIGLSTFVLLCFVGFAVFDSREPREKSVAVADYGEEYVVASITETDVAVVHHKLSVDGDYIIEQTLYPGTVNFVSENFTTDSNCLSLKLHTKDFNVLTYLYNANNHYEPIMQLPFENSKQTFIGLTHDYAYSLGLIIDCDYEVDVSITVSD